MKKLKYIVLILISLFVININDEVNADYVAGTKNSIAGCNGGYCYGGSVGFRITLVNSETGERCKFKINDPDGDGKDVTYELCSSSATENTKSQDYWFNTATLKYYIDKSTNCYTYSTKETKAEHLSNNDYASNITSCPSKFNQLNDLFVDYNDNSNWEGININGESLYPTSNPINMKFVKAWYEARQKDTSASKPGAKDLAAIYNSVLGKKSGDKYYITKDDVINGKILDADKFGIEFEQLLFVINYSGTDIPFSFASMGTVAESTYLYLNKKIDTNIYYYPYRSERWCVVSSMTNPSESNVSYEGTALTRNKWINKDGAEIYNWTGCESFMFSGGYWNGWRDSSSIGKSGGKGYLQGQGASGKATTVPDKTIDNINSYLADFSRGGRNVTGTSSSLDLSSYYSKRTTANIWLFKIGDQYKGSCDTEARKIISSKCSGGSCESSNQAYLKALYDSSYTKKCVNKSGDKYSLKNDCYNLDPGYLKNVGIISADVCSKPTCNDDFLKTLKRAKSSNWINLLNTYFYEKVPGFKYSKILSTIWSDILGLSGPKCDNITPCPPASGTTTAKCNEANKSFTLSDANESESCIINGIAYTDSTATAGSIQSSKDTIEYGSPADPGYCQESVTFNFPTSVNDIKAGTVFKWGTDTNKNSNIFGEMVVHRKCYLSKTIKESDTKAVTTKWANVDTSETGSGRINPDIKVYYQEALPSDLGESYVSKYADLSTGKNLSVYLYNVDLDVYDNSGKEIDADFNEVYYDAAGNKIFYENGKTLFPDYKAKNGKELTEYVGNDPRQFTCSNSDKGVKCSTLNYVDVTATYRIVYNSSLKWYSDKSNDDNIVSGEAEKLDEDDKKVDAKYLSIGYGLPTSFVTPSTYDGNGYGFSISSKNNGGALYATVANIGTRNSDKTYHFTKYLTFSLSDDSDGSDKSKIYYSCGFSIQNFLFDTECRNGICNNVECKSGVCVPKNKPKGIDVVFRTINLIPASANKDKATLAAAITEAFPGRAGAGRKRGKNWTTFNTTSGIESYTDDKLYSILNAQVYENEPMYEITLDVGTIQNIRKNNKLLRASGIDPYTSKENYTFDVDKEGYDSSASYYCRINYESGKITEEEYNDCKEQAAAKFEGYANASTGSDYYTRATSSYLTELMESGKLTGHCTKVTTPSKRGRYFAQTQAGCSWRD